MDGDMDRDGERDKDRDTDAVFRIRIWLDPHSIWAWIQDPDLYSESGYGFWIQMSRNRFKKPKFTMTDFKDKNSKMLRLN